MREMREAVAVHVDGEPYQHTLVGFEKPTLHLTSLKCSAQREKAGMNDGNGERD